jgi:ankyrin repeat protein
MATPAVTPLEQLHEFARRGNLGGVVEIVGAKGAGLVQEKGSMGYTALLWAANAGHLEVVRQLVFEKADVNAAADNGDTALHLCASRDHKQIAKFLVQSGAASGAENDAGETPIQLARSEEMRDALTDVTAANLVQVEQDEDDSDEE